MRAAANFFRRFGGKGQTCATGEFQLSRNLRNPTFAGTREVTEGRSSSTTWISLELKRGTDVTVCSRFGGTDGTTPRGPGGHRRPRETHAASTMEGGFVEAAAEVDNMSLGPVDHLDLHKEILILADPTHVTNGVRERPPLMRRPDKLSFPQNVGRTSFHDRGWGS